MNNLSYNWTLKDAVFTKDKGKVFSCFACGGGSTMGYKLAGFDVIGANEIDPRMAEIYKINHDPKYLYIEDIRTFKTRQDLPEELYNLDILDGSPPCSSFSMSGERENGWGKEKQFIEGQVLQVLDTLFFDFIDLAERLQPKIVIAENVKGLLLGEAKKYVNNIYKAFDKAGYYVSHYLLDASKMGVPQRRERVFFIALRKDLADVIPKISTVDMFNPAPFINMEFNEPGILFKQIYIPGVDDSPITKSGNMFKYWENRKDCDTSLGDAALRLNNKLTCFNNAYIFNDKICCTLPSSRVLILYNEFRNPNKNEVCKMSSFPLDYNFINKDHIYVCGMSVPPLMSAGVALRVWDHWLKYLKGVKT